MSGLKRSCLVLWMAALVILGGPMGEPMRAAEADKVRWIALKDAGAPESPALPAAASELEAPASPDTAAEQPAAPEVSPAVSMEDLDTAKEGWGQGLELDDKNRPVKALDYQERYGELGGLFIGAGKSVYLTFDEGYENGYTASILDTLKKKGVRATFFVTHDYVKRNPELVRRIIDEGHILGNHSWSHPSMPEISEAEAALEITKLHDEVLEGFGVSMSLFRPPMGEFSQKTLALAQSLGYRSAFWSYAYRDWDPENQMGREAAYGKVTGAIHPGAIFLLHAVSKDNAELLGDFIDEVRSRGCEVLPLE
ncbi:polysaccharide deacetylase family protein [Gehongia tenuis]|uniref:Polysaccharide deacetylase family protein n=1 Tax=Gehongia tenuis TaxID=2763655 RepID=A0A926HKE8_9FIRM|nr:polysaccharide deacetylase family protein [Gehongia tenuis]MBC8530897.1 polysaccharide deacetylase family protein [Gehongia tenuis]